MLRDRFSTLGLKTLAIDRIAVCRQNEPDFRFRIIGELVLTSH